VHRDLDAGAEEPGPAYTLAVPPAEETRKTVTVVFADITGSTALGERLDPEPLRRVMSRYFDEMRSVVELHGGTVEKFIGDAVMAVFGIPTLHEDDALRAVRAAVEMRQALERLNEDLEADWAIRLQVRTGVNTGQVVAGDPAGGQMLVTGDAVNLAARLEQVAEPGEILIGPETYRLVRDAVRADPARPLELKGKAEPVAAHRLLEVTAGGPAFARRVDSPLVGRDEELGHLAAVFEQAVSERACRVVTVMGEAGIGKSRLVAELTSLTGDRARVLTGRCLPYGEGITFWPVAEAVKGAAGISEADSTEAARAKIRGLVEGIEDAGLIEDRVASAVGLAVAAGQIQETFWAVRRLLESLARDRPLLVVFEDIHWAEPTLLDLFQYVAGFSRDHPVMLLCTARPDVREVRPDWATVGPLVALERLTEEESQRLIENLLGRAGLRGEVRAHITEAAEGNPLFVEEMLRMLIDDGLLVRSNGHWEPRGDLTAVAVPGTVQALLSARLDRLEAEERSVIQRAAVVGKVFWWGAVTELSPVDVRERVGAHLQTLLRKELVHPDRSSFAGEDAFRFSHILVRDAAYDSMPKQTRAELHERFAGWLEARAGDRIAEYEEILGHHLEQGYRYRAALGPVDDSARDLGRRAAARLAQAGRRSFQRGDMPAAVNLLGRAADLLPEGETARPAVLTDLGAALTDVGEWPRAEEVLTDAAEGAAASGDRRVEWHARVQVAWIRTSRDPSRAWDELLAETKQAIEVFEEVGDEAGLAKAWMLRGEMYNDLTEREEMESAAARVVEHASRAGDRREEALGVRLLGGAMIYGPTPVKEAVSRFEQILQSASDSPMMEVAILPVLALLNGMKGRFAEARALLDRARTLQDELGLRFFSARLAMASTEVEMLAGNPVAAEREARRGCEIFKEMGETGRFSTLACQLADALYALGRDGEAYAYTLEGEKASAPEDVEAQSSWRRVRAKVLARRGEVDQAEELIRESLRVAETSPDDVHLHSKVFRDMAEVLRLAGRPGEGRRFLQRALDLEERKGNVPSASRIRVLLEKARA
jgi:class 3 adenylate cyclase/tetratricopeptide (TPR) repeat protein